MNSQELQSALKTNPGYSWANLSEEYKNLMSDQIRPEGGFTSEQIEFLRDFYLIVSAQQLETMRQHLPSTQGLSTKETTEGELCLSAMLLTDSQRPGDNWHVIGDALAELEIRYIRPDQFLEVIEDL